jgi:peptidoglycan/LPS O-acetylase OafA/YrhL
MQYRREIDGLRALAVMPVILFHAGFETFSGGFVGVDVFFVISGFLITSIILADLADESFSFAKFYEKRARRILPMLAVVAMTTMPFAWWWQTPPHTLEFTKSLSYVATFSSNLFFYDVSGYFDSASELKPMLHTWSLAVEEQYYLIFPAVVWVVWKKWRRAVGYLLVVTLLISLVWSEYQVRHDPTYAFFMLHTRIWEMLAGALTAWCIFLQQQNLMPTWFMRILRPVHAYKPVLTLLGLALIVGAVFGFSADTATPGLAALVPVVGAVLVIACAVQGSLATRLLSSRALVGIGLISYSAYLWHQPIFALARHATQSHISAPLALVLICLTLMLAAFSWKYVEQPFRSGTLVTRRLFWSLVTVMLLVMLVLGHAGRKTQGFETLYNNYRLSGSEREIYQFIKQHTSEKFNESDVDNGECNFRVSNLDPSVEARLAACAKLHGSAIVVLGDSHAINIYNALYRAKHAPFLLGFVKGSCRAHDEKKLCPYQPFFSLIESKPNLISYVIYHQAGAYFLADSVGRLDSQRAFENSGSWIIQRDNLNQVARYLDRISVHVETYWLGPFTEARVQFADVRQFKAGYSMNPISIEAFAQLDAEIEKIWNNGLERRWKFLPFTEFVPIGNDFLRHGDCLRFRDEDHLSVCGEEYVGNILSLKLHEKISLSKSVKFYN